jgi:glycosyltransferase
MLISFVIPSLNDDRIISTISSIKNIGIRPELLEIIVQDAGSNTDVIDMIKSNLRSHDKLYIENDTGIFDGINRGLEKVSGDIVVVLGTDDRVKNFDYKKIKSLFKQGFDVVIAHLEYTDQEWNIVRFWKARRISHFSHYFGRQYAHYSFICRPEFYKKFGYFNVKNNVNADYEFFYHCSKRTSEFKQVLHDQTIIQMRVGGTSSRDLSTVLLANLNIARFLLKNSPFMVFGMLLKPFHKVLEYFFARRR